MSELPKGRIVIRGDDIGVIGAVVVEVDGRPICLLAPNQAVRTMESSGRSATAITFGSGGSSPVRWDSDPPGDQNVLYQDQENPPA